MRWSILLCLIALAAHAAASTLDMRDRVQCIQQLHCAQVLP
jgi:hypothetical protein